MYVQCVYMCLEVHVCTQVGVGEQPWVLILSLQLVWDRQGLLFATLYTRWRALKPLELSPA